MHSELCVHFYLQLLPPPRLPKAVAPATAGGAIGLTVGLTVGLVGGLDIALAVGVPVLTRRVRRRRGLRGSGCVRRRLGGVV